MVDCGQTTFSFRTVKANLEAVGYERGTIPFLNELDRCYADSGTNNGRYIERADWDGDFVPCSDTSDNNPTQKVQIDYTGVTD